MPPQSGHLSNFCGLIGAHLPFHSANGSGIVFKKYIDPPSARIVPLM
jgi:hypothetical protein